MDDERASDLVVNELYPVALDQARWRAIGECLLVPFFATFLLLFGIFRGFSGTLMPLAFVLVGGVGATVRDVRWWLWLRHADPREAYARLQADGAGQPFRPGDAFRETIGIPITFVGFAIYAFTHGDRLLALTLDLLGLLLCVRAPRAERKIRPGPVRRIAGFIAFAASMGLIFAASAFMLPLWWASLAVLTAALLIWHSPEPPRSRTDAPQ